MKPVLVIAALVTVAAGLLAASSSAASAQGTTIAVGEYWFCDSSHQGNECLTTIHVGDTVTWDFSGAMATHTTTACTDYCNWDSGNMSGGTFSFTFDTQGGYLYHCNIHPTLMMGRIEVLPLPTDTVTQPSPIADGAPAATSTPPPVLPHSGTGRAGGADSVWRLIVALGAAGITLAGAGALSYARRRSG